MFTTTAVTLSPLDFSGVILNDIDKIDHSQSTKIISNSKRGHTSWTLYTRKLYILDNCKYKITLYIRYCGLWSIGVGYQSPMTLHWRHSRRDGVSNHQPHDCLLNRLFGRRSKKTSKPCVTGLCAGNSPVRTNGQKREKCFHFMTSSWQSSIFANKIWLRSEYLSQSVCSLEPVSLRWNNFNHSMVN